jgi:hypothetical protein
MAMKRLEKPSGALGPSGKASTASELLGTCPDLMEFLSRSKWDDGRSRVPGTIMVFVDGSEWKMRLADRDTGQVSFISARTLDDLFTAAELGLGVGDLPWRVDRPPKGR